MDKKSLSRLLLCLLFFLLNVTAFINSASAVEVDPAVGDLNLDIDISSISPEILSGNNAVFRMNLKVTGNQVEYDNVLIHMNLPDNAVLANSLDELAIKDVIPIYNADKNQLEYRIPKLMSGIAEQILYTFNTEKGLENNTKVALSADLSADNFKQVTTTADTIVISTLEQTLQKTYTQTFGPDNKVVNRAPIKDDTGEWLLSFNIPNKEYGQAYLKPGSVISITDTLPDSLTYVSDNHEGKYDSSNRTVTWQFQVPSIEDQQKSDGIFSIEIKLKSKFTVQQTANSTTVSNTMKTSVIDAASNVTDNETKATVNQGPGSNGVPVIPPSGSLIIFVHYGPSDGAGNGTSETNPNPTVGPDSLLRFFVTQPPYTADSSTKNFSSYEMNYKIDDKLTLVKLAESEKITYRPNASFPDGFILPPEANVMDVYATVGGVEKNIITGFIPGKTYNRSEFNNYNTLDSHISSLRYVSRDRHAGAITFQQLYFTPKPSVSGRATNQININYKGFNRKDAPVVYTSDFTSDTFANVSSVAGPRYVNISQTITNISKPIVSTTIELTKQTNGIVEIGENQIAGALTLEKTSKTLIDAPYSAYVILPKGVKYNANTTSDSTDYQVELVNSNYNNLNQEVIQITWHTKDQLRTGNSLSFDFGVNVTQIAPSLVVPTMYTYIGTKQFEVPFYSNDAITNTSIVNNKHDLNGSGNEDEYVLLTKNQYSIVRSNKIIAKELVKGELDREYTEFGYTTLGGDVDYRLELTNHGDAGKDFILMNVLPSIGDLGITDNEPLNTLFDPVLTGPVTLPIDTADEYIVYYSMSKNPSRVDLIKDVDWPSSTEPIKDPPGAEVPNWMTEDQVVNWEDIHSFMVKGLEEYPIINEEKLTIDFHMKAPEMLSDELLDGTVPGSSRAAWNSFAYTINNLQPVEPMKIGVAVNKSAFNLKIIKEISDTNTKLESAEFTLYDNEHLIIESGISDEKGEIYFDDLSSGTYYLQETNAPPGYALNSKMYELEISEDGLMTINNSDGFIKGIVSASTDSPTISLTVANDAVLKLPETGSYKLLMTLVMGGLLSGLSGIYHMKKREVN